MMLFKIFASCREREDLRRSVPVSAFALGDFVARVQRGEFHEIDGASRTSSRAASSPGAACDKSIDRVEVGLCNNDRGSGCVSAACRASRTNSGTRRFLFGGALSAS